MDCGQWIMNNNGPRTMDPGHWITENGPQTMNHAQWITDITLLCCKLDNWIACALSVLMFRAKKGLWFSQGLC